MNTQSRVPDIHIEDAMRRAWREGVFRYRPIFQDEPLDEECGQVEVTLKNLRKIVKGGAKVCGFHVSKAGTVLVCFNDGQSYLATGFAVGERDIKVKALSQFTAEIGLGTLEKIHEFLAALPDNYEGPLEFPVAGDTELRLVK